MAKLVGDAVLDAALQYLETNVDWISVCAGAPTTYEHAHSNVGTGTGKVLAHSATPTFTGPIDKVAAGGGRQTTVDQEATITVDVTGAADHVALCFTGSTLLSYVTTCTEQTLTAANTVTIPAWIIAINDPT